VQTCTTLFPIPADRVGVRELGDKSFRCDGSVEGVSVVVEPRRDGFKWQASRYWVAGKEVTLADFREAIESEKNAIAARQLGNSAGKAVKNAAKSAADFVSGLFKH
jgi:hypothetical protein